MLVVVFSTPVAVAADLEGLRCVTADRRGPADDRSTA